ncbi:tryptophanyl-tRNA synthetase [compost metagenome]
MKMLKFDEEYYKGVIEEYNYNPMELRPLDFNFGSVDVNTMKKKWLCHQDGDMFIKGYQDKQQSIITTGVGLSGSPHIGTLSQILRTIYLQQAGFTVQFVLGDLDSYNARNQSMSVLEERADKYTILIRELGFDTEKGILRSQNLRNDVLKTAYLISNCLTDQDFLEAEEDLSDLYKKKGIYSGIQFPVKQAILLMVADFVDLGMHHNFKQVLVMLGLEEHLYVLLARKVIERMGIPMKLSALYSRIVKGLNGYPKMSKSIKGSGITVEMSEDEIMDLIMNREGEYCNPWDSVVYQMMCSVSYYNSSELENLEKKCALKSTEWQKAKRDYAEVLIEICKKWPK